jgi:serine/threonine protein kinase
MGTHYEVLYEISSSSLGALSLGRTVGGREADRPVLLRALEEGSVARLEAALTRATSIAHPRLLKTLGLTYVDGRAYLVTEYVEGLPLSELARPVHAAAVSVVPEVALRITLDALLAVSAARDELARFGMKSLPRCLYADTAWIANFGETLLSDAGIACELLNQRPATSSDQQSDVFAAGSLLWELLSGRRLSNATDLEQVPNIEAVQMLLPSPRPLLDLVARAVSLDPAKRFGNVEAMADAIQELPVHWIATDAEVRAAVDVLTQAMPSAFNGTEGAASGEHEIDPWDTPTRSLRSHKFAPSLPPRGPDATTQRPPLPPRTPRPNGSGST